MKTRNQWVRKRKLGYLVIIFLFSFQLFSQDVKNPTPQWRPQYHFTPLKNWTNDPNGLIYLNGQYHLYNQQNPYENIWGHMSWGHATSMDLVHWKHLPLAIPEIITKNKDTTWIFSGCAVWDTKNSSGFCKKGGCLVAIYTADQPNRMKESQFIAYSNDQGMTFTNYKNNPVLDLHLRNFRDPNVSWNEKLKQWLMVVALPKDHKVWFYSSANLKDWNLLSEFGPEGFISAEWECPFFLELPVMGNANLKKWVLVVSAGGPARGPYMQYFIGDFDGKRFINDNPANTILSFDYGDCLYAAIPWNNLPDNKKTFVGWLEPGIQETYPWKGQMSIPRDIQLRQTSEGVRLIQKPASVIEDNLSKLSRNRVFQAKNLKVGPAEKNFGNGSITESNSYWLDAELSLEPGVTAGFKIARRKGTDNAISSEAIIGYDGSKHQIFLDRSHIANGESRKDQLRQTIDLQKADTLVRLEILFDKSSLEIFVNGGEEVLSAYIYPDRDAHGISAFSDGGRTIIKTLKIWDLSKKE